MPQEVGALLPMWETKIEFLATDISPAKSWSLWTFGSEPTYGSSLCVALSQVNKMSVEQIETKMLTAFPIVVLF